MSFMPPQRGFAPQMQPQQPQMARPRPMDVAGPMINPGVGQGPVNNVPGMNMYGQQAPQPANAYFASNPDVAAAYQQNSYGMTPDRFALQQFQQYGQNEGRQWSGPSAPQSPNILQSSLAQRGAAPTGLLSPFMNQQTSAALQQAQQPAAMQGGQAASSAPPGFWANTPATAPAQNYMTPAQVAAINNGSGLSQPEWNQITANASQQFAQNSASQANQAQMMGLGQQQAQMQAQNPWPGAVPGYTPNAQQQAFIQQMNAATSMPSRAAHPQALGQSANYSPANRPVSPWFGYSGVNY